LQKRRRLSEHHSRHERKRQFKLAVYSHIVTKELQGKTGEDQIIARTRAAGYDGPLVMGVDRMAFEIADGVKVIAPQSIDDLQNLDSEGQQLP
jgi:ribonuclease Z